MDSSLFVEKVLTQLWSLVQLSLAVPLSFEFPMFLSFWIQGFSRMVWAWQYMVFLFFFVLILQY